MKILALAGDAGGARALQPVLERLRSRADVGLHPQAYAAAVSIWRQAGLAPLAPDPAFAARVDRVLLGTSWQPERWEQKTIVRARQAGVRTVSVLDGWANYRVRFEDESRSLILPDAIAVMDGRAAAEMKAAGFLEDRLHITGQPAFEETLRFADPAVAVRARSHAVKEWRLGEGELFCLYASQPLSVMEGEPWGFTEQEVLADIVRELRAVLTRRQRRGLLLIKRHPRETGTLWNGINDPAEPLRTIEVGEASIDYRELIAAADVVLGMNSNLLLEACLLGRPVVSYQPNLRRPDPLPTNAWGVSRAVVESADLQQALDEEIFDDTRRTIGKDSRRRIALVPHATDNVLKLLLG